VCGLTALSRSETVLLFGLLLVPITLFVRGQDWRRRLRLLAVALLTAVVTIAPWVSYNLVRFEKPLYLSSPDPTLLAGNCDDTYYGGLIGYWSLGCLKNAGSTAGGNDAQNLIGELEKVHGDTSIIGATYRKAATKYIRAHLSRLPFVVFAREGRTFGFYRPSQQLQLDEFAPREMGLSRVALGMFYVFAVGMIAGMVIMRRRRIPITPFLALLGSVVLTVALTIGETRYRAVAEVPLVVGTAVAIDALFTRFARRPDQVLATPDDQSVAVGRRNPEDAAVRPSAQVGEPGAPTRTS
jgi:hypothetical protein